MVCSSGKSIKEKPKFDIMGRLKVADSFKKLTDKYRDVIPYIFFGICTTLANVATYWFGAHVIHLPVMESTIIAWIVGVLFAYMTNRKWVFKSKVYESKALLKEMFSFIGCRFGTGVIDLMCMWIFVDFLCFDDVIIKFIANVIVIILNYILSKLVIFKK